MQALAWYEQALERLETQHELKEAAAEAAWNKAYYNWGTASLWIHNTQQAYADFSRRYELDPTYIYAAWRAAWAALSKQHDGIETAAHLEQIATIDPQHYLSSVCRGVALGLRGQLKAGLAALEQAIALDSEEWDAYFWKGMLSAYYHQARSQETITLAAIEQSLQLGLPPVLLTPLYWLEQDRPAIFASSIKPLLAAYGM